MYVRRDYVDSLEMFFAKCELPINKQLERYAWFGGSPYYSIPRGWSPILSGSRVSYKIFLYTTLPPSSEAIIIMAFVYNTEGGGGGALKYAEP